MIGPNHVEKVDRKLAAGVGMGLESTLSEGISADSFSTVDIAGVTLSITIANIN